MKLTREFYRPNAEFCKDVKVRQYSGVPGAEVWTYLTRNGKLGATMFGGRRQKPDNHYTYFNEKHREESIQRWLDGQRRHAEYREERKVSRSKPHNFEVGQIFVESWGYDQTNIDYYMLTKLKGKCTGYIVPIGSKIIGERGGPQETVAPDPDHIRDWDTLLSINRNDTEKGKWKRLRPDGVTICNGHWATPCSADSTRSQTGFGWGH